jgi:hypothetical protein
MSFLHFGSKTHFIYVLIIDLEKEKEVVRKNREKFIGWLYSNNQKNCSGVNELHFIGGIPLSFFFFFLIFISNLARKNR